ncbi:BnaC01g15120D [Brassica napus]|uniref:BnaC01g15120D protein n=2 Tax=Brassica TaxID=3705 RepID=A0A078FD46_BRANA|nr:BnaC01g15120D [Brassica napus]VDD49362.1 unnamed protein product [Brassica oleracea]
MPNIPSEPPMPNIPSEPPIYILIAIVATMATVAEKSLSTQPYRVELIQLSQLSRFADYGGSLLFVPAGRWLTGSFNLTSHFTLFLHRDAVLLASQEESDYEVIEPLPSYGRGRETDGGRRFISLRFGSNLTDVVITSENGTIDGQGEPWWGKFKGGELKYTRPYLIEIMHSDGIQISNLTFLNSPSWHIHPVYSSNIVIQGLTILAPVTVPNTTGSTLILARTRGSKTATLCPETIVWL